MTGVIREGCQDGAPGEVEGRDQKPTSSADEKTAEGGLLVVGRSELGDRPEEDGTESVKSETHDDGELVRLSLEDLSGDVGESEVSETEVHDLKTGRLEPSDIEDLLGVLVQDTEREEEGQLRLGRPEGERGTNSMSP